MYSFPEVIFPGIIEDSKEGHHDDNEDDETAPILQKAVESGQSLHRSVIKRSDDRIASASGIGDNRVSPTRETEANGAQRQTGADMASVLQSLDTGNSNILKQQFWALVKVCLIVILSIITQ